MDTKNTTHDEASEVTVTAKILDQDIIDINKLPIGLTKLACPSCGQICNGNLPSRPDLNEKPSESDGACLHCKAKFTIRRYSNNSTQIIAITSMLNSNIDINPSIDGFQVALISLGANMPTSLQLDRIAKRASKIQRTYKFTYIDSIKGIGEPDCQQEILIQGKNWSPCFTLHLNLVILLVLQEQG